MELNVLKDLLVLGSWSTALETYTENGPDCVHRVAGSWTWFSVHGSQLWKHKHIIELIVFRSNCWFTVPGSWFTVMETHIENGADWVKWIKYNRLKPEMLFSVHGDMVHSFGNSQR